jgi:sporulation protein YunB
MKFKKKASKRLIAIPIALLVTVIAAYIIFDSAIRPAVFSLAEIKLKAIAGQSVNDAVKETLGAGLDYSDLIDIEKDDTGRIRSLSARAVNINDLSAEISLAIQGKMENIGEQGIDIPIGTVIGGPFFTGRGPSINVKAEPVGVVNTEFLTAFESAGINQTRHLIYIAVHVNMRIAIANTVEQVNYSSSLLIADTVIVGEIPQEYMRLGNPGEIQSLAPMLLMDMFSEDGD